MSKTLVTLALLCASLQGQVTGVQIAANAEPSAVSADAPVYPVIEWNKTLLVPDVSDKLDAELEQDLAQIPEGQNKADGVTVGQKVAAQILAFRGTDGANVTLPPNVPGNYKFTPPNFIPADFIQWPQVTPFALARADEFRPWPPPQLTSEEYTRTFDEVKSLGFITSKTRTRSRP